MLSDHISRFNHPSEQLGQNHYNESSFLDKPYYAIFLQRLGLKEIKDENLYFLVYQGGKNWTVCLEDVTTAMLDMMRQGDLQSSEALSLLMFVIRKLDRNQGIPQFVRTYMCRDAVKRVVLQRFKEEIGGNYTNLMELSYKISDNIEEANDIFNSIRICDPAIGSGLFLVTLMNEMIAIKSQLGILADKDGNPLFRYKVVADDEYGLLVYDRKNLIPYKFFPSDPESRRIQDTLLREKKTIIDDCLFGVDIEHFAVSLSKLRLWSELLRHVCWTGHQMLSFPLIEGNLRCGDALVSRLSVQEDLKPVFKHTGYSVADYKKWVNDFKNAITKEDKKSTAHIIALIQQRLLLEMTLDDRSNKDLLKWQKELAVLQSPGLFELDEAEVKAIKTKQIEAQAMVDKYKQRIDETLHNPVYDNAIEWRFEFPELLNESGDFIGFDFVIGNPPEPQNRILSDSMDIYKQANYPVFKSTGNISSLYYELGYTLLKPDYFLSYIASNSWMKSILADKMRMYLLKETNPLLLIEFKPADKIDESLEEQGITLLQKARNQHRMMTCRIKDDFDRQAVTLEDYIHQNSGLFMIDAEEATVAPAFTILPDIEKRIKEKIEQSGTLLKSWDIQMNTGIRTGFDEAFVIDGKTKDEFILADYKNIDIIKSLLLGENIRRYRPDQLNLWLIGIPWHFPLLYDKTIKVSSEKAEERFRQQYPLIFKHLAKHKERLLARNTKEVGVIFEWYAVQRFGANNEWEDFTKPKIIWKRETSMPNFCLDYNGCAIMDTTCFATGQHLKYLLGVFNSKLGGYMLRDAPRLSNGDMHINIPTLEALKIPIPNIKFETEVISLVNKRTSDAYQNDFEELDYNINQLVYDMYGLDTDEREYIEEIVRP